MIIIVAGKIGSGKTYGAVAAALFNVTKNRKVALNWDVTLNEDEKPMVTRYAGLKELETLGVTGTDVFCDEAHKELGSRDWENLTPRLRNSFSESRKDDNHLIFISQDYKFLDVYVRRLGEEVWQVYKILCWTVWVKAESANPETGELGAMADVRIFRRPLRDLEHAHPFGSLWNLWNFSKTIAGRYDTHRKTELAKKADAKKKSPAGSVAPTAAAEPTTVPFL